VIRTGRARAEILGPREEPHSRVTFPGEPRTGSREDPRTWARAPRVRRCRSSPPTASPQCADPRACAALPATPGRAPHTPAATHTLRPRPASPGRGRAPRPW